MGCLNRELGRGRHAAAVPTPLWGARGRSGGRLGQWLVRSRRQADGAGSTPEAFWDSGPEHTMPLWTYLRFPSLLLSGSHVSAGPPLTLGLFPFPVFLPFQGALERLRDFSIPVIIPCRRGKSKVEKSTTLAELPFSEVIYRGGHQYDLFFVFSQQNLGDFHCDFEVCTVRTPKSVCFSPRGMPFSRCLSLRRLQWIH